MSSLTPEQLSQVEQWAAAGATLNDVQTRLKNELGISLTYLEARLLMLDVGVRLKDKPREQPRPEEPAPAPAPAGDESPEAGIQNEDESPVDVDDPQATPGGTVTLTADQITTPGALISGKVTFSDGQTANWQLDQFGRLGLGGAPQGYQPPRGDIPQFQQQLDLLMQRAGF